jgi:hypothetical protein
MTSEMTRTNEDQTEEIKLSFLFLRLGHRSRSKAECASLLEEDEDDGDDASAPCEGNSRSLSVGSLGRHADAGICDGAGALL